MAPVLRKDMVPDHREPNFESFPKYLVRNIGFRSENDCPNLIHIATEYLKCVEGTHGKILDYFSHEEKPEEMCIKLIEELERDMRFETTQKKLKVQRLFCTLIDQIKTIRGNPVLTVPEPTERNPVPAVPEPSERNPVLLLLGGGTSVGKSTVLQLVLRRGLWSGSAGNVVVVDSDKFKASDVLVKTVHENIYNDPEDIVCISDFVHPQSVAAAESVLVTALNNGSDIILDGTLSYSPFAVQTISMARSVHKYEYKMGKGRTHSDGREIYWEKIEGGVQPENRKPYRIQLVGVFCDPYLAVVRNFRRSLKTGRCVNIKTQLKSMRGFAKNYDLYCHLVDEIQLYNTNVAGYAKHIARKSKYEDTLIIEDKMETFRRIRDINIDADSAFELFQNDPQYILGKGTLYQRQVLRDDREKLQREIVDSVMRINDPKSR